MTRQNSLKPAVFPITNTIWSCSDLKFSKLIHTTVLKGLSCTLNMICKKFISISIYILMTIEVNICVHAFIDPSSI